MAKKTTTKKAAAKKAPANKVATKKASVKAAAVKAPAVQPDPVKTVATEQPTPVKAAPVKKAAPVSVKKVASKKPEETSIIARVDVGFGNTLYVRGEGAGLSWDQGVALDNVSAYEWAFKTTKANGKVAFKFLINDEVWAEGENLTLDAGDTSISSPTFVW